MNRALWAFALLTVALVAVATKGGLYLLGNTESDEKKSPPAADVANGGDQTPKDGGSAPVGNPPRPDDNPNVRENAKAAAPRKPDDAPSVVETSKPASSPNQAVTSKDFPERRQLLEILGALTASHCYQTYLNIGLIADGRTKGTYTEKDAYKLLDSVLALVNSVDRKLAALDRVDLDKEDRMSLEQMRTLAILLRKQAKELQNYWDTGKEEDAAHYENARKDTWAALSKLTGISR